MWIIALEFVGTNEIVHLGLGGLYNKGYNEEFTPHAEQPKVS